MKADIKTIMESTSPRYNWKTEIQESVSIKGLFILRTKRDDEIHNSIYVTKKDVQAMLDFINSKGVA